MELLILALWVLGWTAAIRGIGMWSAPAGWVAFGVAAIITARLIQVAERARR